MNQVVRILHSLCVFSVWVCTASLGCSTQSVGVLFGCSTSKEHAPLRPAFCVCMVTAIQDLSAVLSSQSSWDPSLPPHVCGCVGAYLYAGTCSMGTCAHVSACMWRPQDSIRNIRRLCPPSWNIFILCLSVLSACMYVCEQLALPKRSEDGLDLLELKLEAVVNHYVVAGNGTQVLWMSSKYS